MSKKPKICFVCPYVYPLFNPDIKTMFGGWEVRIATIAREIARNSNFDVSIIVADHGQPHREVWEGIEFISWIGKKIYGISAQNPSGLIKDPAPIVPPDMDGDFMSPSAQSRSDTVSGLVNNPEFAEQNVSMSNNAGASRRFREPLKRFYKRVVPWQARIIFTGMASGIKPSIKHLLVTWKAAAKLVIRGVWTSITLYISYVRRPLKIARIAVGDIADLPVYYEQIKIFDEAQADVYIAPGNNHISAEAAFYCKKWKKAYIMLAGSDIDFSQGFLLNPHGVDLYSEPNVMKLYTIQNADVHIVQNERQVELAQKYGLSPVMIRNPLNMERVFPKIENPNLILWIGNTDERVKRPSILLKVARKLPEYQFLMIVTPTIEADYDRLCAEAGMMTNLEIISRVSFKLVEQYYAQAKLFVNTSTFEGFPNTFLQAGKYGVPVISLKVDPNGFLSQHGCGFACNDDQDQLISNIKKLMSDSGVYARTSQTILDYVRQNHDKEVIIPQIENQIRGVLARKGML